MYRLLHSGMLDDYVERIEGETYLDMGGKGRKPTLARHVMTLVNWQADFQLIDFDPIGTSQEKLPPAFEPFNNNQ